MLCAHGASQTDTDSKKRKSETVSRHGSFYNNIAGDSQRAACICHGVKCLVVFAFYCRQSGTVEHAVTVVAYVHSLNVKH